MKCLFLYNPHSGRGKITKKLDYIRKRLERRYQQVDIVATSSAEDMEAKAREGAKEQYDLILFSGGDGTFNNVLQGIGDEDIQLGYLPAGTVNDVARSLGIPRSVKGALNVVLKGRSEQLDCMRVNGTHYVIYVAAAGAFTSTTYLTPQSHKKKLGRIAYALHGLKYNLDFKVFPLRVTCGDVSFETHSVLVLVMNGRSVASVPINRSASMQDGTLEVVLIRQKEKPGFFRKLGGYIAFAAMVVFGVRVKRRDVRFLRGESVRIETMPDLVWDFDGEVGTLGDIQIEVVPRHVRLFVPRRKKI